MGAMSDYSLWLEDTGRVDSPGSCKEYISLRTSFGLESKPRPMFTLRHYEAVAATLKLARAAHPECRRWQQAIGHTVARFAEVFDDDNPRFKLAAFLAASSADSEEE